MIPQRYEPHVPLDRLTPHPMNANDGDRGLLSTLLDANGFGGAVLAQESTGLLIDGETRWRTALEKGMTGLPVIWLDVDDDSRDRLLASLNESTRRGRNDEAKLVALLTGLAQTPRGLEGAAFDGDDLDELMAALNGEQGGGGGAGGGDPDDAPEPPAEPRSVPGDLLLLGPHRLLCGDATNPDHLKRVTDGLGEIGIVYTDPPYGIRAVPKDGGVSRGKLAVAAKYAQVTGDETTETVTDAFRLLCAEYPAARHVWWGANHYAASAGLPDASCWLVWDKDNHGNDFADCELAWTNHPGAVRMLTHMWNGMLRASERGKRVHPTQKPVILAEWAFSVIDPKDERKTVLDVFGGSGSTLIAAHRTGRTAAIVECEAAYVDVIAARWQAATSIVPERVLPDGSTEPVSFAEPSP
jgi:site-specific DNA-methyltransferase (adenine-specific)